MVVGILALQVAYEGSQQSMDSRGAIAAIGGQPFGQFLLWFTGVGLFAYALWQFAKAALDPDNEGGGIQGIAKRGAFAVSGIVHTGLAWVAVQSALGAAASSGGNAADDWTALAMQQPLGRWLVALAGIAIGIGAITQAYAAYSASFMDRMNGSMSSTSEKWMRRAGRAGYAVRCIVFLTIAYFLTHAALTYDAEQAVGLHGALRELLQQSYGSILLALAAAGLFFFGAFTAMEAKYRELPGN